MAHRHIFLALCLCPTVLGQLLGGWTEKKVNDPVVQSIADFALPTVDAYRNSMMRAKIIEITHVETQVKWNGSVDLVCRHQSSKQLPAFANNQPKTFFLTGCGRNQLQN